VDPPVSARRRLAGGVLRPARRASPPRSRKSRSTFRGAGERAPHTVVSAACINSATVVSLGPWPRPA